MDAEQTKARMGELAAEAETLMGELRGVFAAMFELESAVVDALPDELDDAIDAVKELYGVSVISQLLWEVDGIKDVSPAEAVG